MHARRLVKFIITKQKKRGVDPASPEGLNAGEHDATSEPREEDERYL